MAYKRAKKRRSVITELVRAGRSSRGVNNNTVSVVNLIYQYAFAHSGSSNYNSASALGVILMLVLAVFSAAYLWLTRDRGERA